MAGLYAANHGVTANEIYDNESGRLIKYSMEMFMMNNEITPIWTLNELAGKHSAVSMWAAAEFQFQGKILTYNEPFNRKTHWKQRIDNIIPLLTRNESQVDFVMFYVEHPDLQSHSFSSQSAQVRNEEKDRLFRKFIFIIIFIILFLFIFIPFFFFTLFDAKGVREFARCG